MFGRVAGGMGEVQGCGRTRGQDVSLGWKDGQDHLALALCQAWESGAPGSGRRGADTEGVPRCGAEWLPGKGAQGGEVSGDRQGAE